MKRCRYTFGKPRGPVSKTTSLLEAGVHVVRTRRPTGTTVGTNRRVLPLLVFVDQRAVSGFLSCQMVGASDEKSRKESRNGAETLTRRAKRQRGLRTHKDVCRRAWPSRYGPTSTSGDAQRKGRVGEIATAWLPCKPLAWSRAAWTKIILGPYRFRQKDCKGCLVLLSVCRRRNLLQQIQAELVL